MSSERRYLSSAGNVLITLIECWFDMNQIADDDFIFDLGTMMGCESTDDDRHEKIGHTTLLKRCCGEALCNRFETGVPLPDGQKLKVNRYHWCLMWDIDAITIEPCDIHIYRRTGFLYLQIYPSIKNLFECQAYYPYPRDDDTGIALALDDPTIKAIYSSAGHPVSDREACRNSWLHSGRRVSHPLLTKADRSYFTRIEVRITRTLYGHLRRELEIHSVQAHCNMVVPQDIPFYVHPTAVIKRFIFSVSQPAARLFQEVISLCPPGRLGIDHQKLAVALFELQKASYTAVDLTKIQILWGGYGPKTLENRIQKNKPIRKMGLGLSKTIKKYRVAYPSEGLIDWVELGFTRHEIAEAFPNPAETIVNLEA